MKKEFFSLKVFKRVFKSTHSPLNIQPLCGVLSLTETPKNYKGKYFTATKMRFINNTSKDITIVSLAFSHPTEMIENLRQVLQDEATLDGSTHAHQFYKSFGLLKTILFLI